MKKSKTWVLLLIGTFIVSYIAIAVVSAQTEITANYSTIIPTIDGSVATGEWDDASEYDIDLGTGAKVRFKHDGTDLYTLLKVKDGTTNDFVDPLTPHDWAGIEFDLDGDQKCMGTSGNPDDAEFVNWMVSGGEDWWLAGKSRSNDSDSGGVDNVVAAYGGALGGYTYWEFKKTLNSGDTDGYDIAMNPDASGYGLNTIYIMFAYQDGKAIGKKHGYNSPWYTLSLEPTTPPPPALKHDVAVDSITAPTEAVQGDTVSISVAVSNPGDYDENFDVKVSNDTTIIETRSVSLTAGGSKTESFSWNTEGVTPATYTLTAEAILAGDEDPANDVKTTTILIKSPPPVKEPPVASFTWTPETPVASETVTFDASASSDPDGTIVSYAWDFGDGTPTVDETDPITYHTFTDAGTYTVTLTVTDNDGLTDTTSATIEVVLPPPPAVEYLADLVRKSGWPERHHFDQSAEQDKGRDLINTLYGKVGNLGTGDVLVKVVFTIYDANGAVVNTLETDEYLLTLAESIVNLTAPFDTSTHETGKYYVSAQCWYDSNGDLIIDATGAKLKTFSFAVVP